MAAGVDFIPLHDGPHNSASDLTAGDWVFLVVCLLALVGLGFAIWAVLKRRRGDQP